MKQLRIFALTVLTIFGIVSCQPDTEFDTKIKLGQKEVVLSADGAAVSIGYMIENGVEGESLTVDYEADWLSVSTARARSIEFSATLNDTGAERSVQVKLSYKGAQSVPLLVKQSKLSNTLAIEISDVTATEVVFDVTASDPELTWIPAVVSKEYDDYYTDEQMVETDIEWLQYSADNQEISLELYLEQVLAVGSMKDIYFDSLEPETDYVLYAYGLTYDARRTTELVKVPFTTEKAWTGDITVDFKVSEEDHIITFTATPSYTGVPYYCHYATEKEIERWKEVYGTDDMKVLIEKGSIGELYDGLVNIGFFEDKSNFFSWFNSTGSIRDNYFPCKASTKYTFFAVKWDEECNLVGEVSLYEYTSQPVAPSNNQITLSVSNITQSTATVEAKVTNDDPYVIYPVESRLLEGKTNEEIFEYMDAHYYLSEFTFSGNTTREFALLKSSAEYTFVAFGHKAKTMTTSEIYTVEFTTLKSEDPSACTFDFEYNVYEESVWVEVAPSDMGHYYYWGVFDARYDEADVKQYIGEFIDESYDGDAAIWASWWLKKGVQSEEVGGLIPDTEYRIAAVIMDYETGDFLADVQFSEVFKTPEAVYADLQIEVLYDKYFDLDELYNAGYTEYKDEAVLSDSRFEKGGAIVPTEIEITGDYAGFFYYIVYYDLTDTTQYPDQIFIDDFIYNNEGSTSKQTIFPVTYDTYWTVVAVAIDKQGNYTPVYREKIFLMRDGASPVSEFVAPQNNAPARVSAVRWNNYNEGKVGVRTPQRAIIAPVEVVYVEPNAKCEPSNLECTKALMELRRANRDDKPVVLQRLPR